MMTLALYKRPLIILTLFWPARWASIFAPEQRYAQWQWTQSDEALPTIARYDLIHSYPAQDGALLLISKRSESGLTIAFTAGRPTTSAGVIHRPEGAADAGATRRVDL